MRTEHIKKLESEIINFAERHGWEVIRGMNGSLGSYWIKDGKYRMVSIEPRNYGCLIGISNMLFTDLFNEKTCMLKLPRGEHRFDKHKLTKIFWKVTSEEDLLIFLKQ